MPEIPTDRVNASSSVPSSPLRVPSSPDPVGFSLLQDDELSQSFTRGHEDAEFYGARDFLRTRYGEEEKPERPEGDQSSELPAPRSALTSGLKAAGHGILRGTQAFWQLFDDTATLISRATGWEKQGLFQDLVKMAEPPSDWTPRDLSEKIVSGIAAAGPTIGAITAFPGSAPVTMGYMGAITGGAAEGWEGAGREAAKGVLLGNILHGAGILRPGVRVPAMAGIFGGETAAAGGTPEQVAESAAVGGILGVMGKPGKGVKELARDAKEYGGMERQESSKLKAESSKEEAPASMARASLGAETEVLHGGGSETGRYALVELADLVASHKAGEAFAENPAYPAKTQERQYHRAKDEQAKVLLNAQNYDPRYTVNTDPTLVNGPPAVTQEGIVLGGNSRIMSLDIVYRENPAAAVRYREAMQAQADMFGIPAGEVAAFDQPVLVRILDPGEQGMQDLPRLVRQYNQPPTHGIEQTAEGVSRARLVSPQTLTTLTNGLQDFQTLREYLGNAKSRDLITDLAADGALDQAQLGRLIQKDTGLFTDEGKRLVEQMIRGRIFEDPDFIGRVPAGIMGRLDLSLPALVRVQARGDSWNLVPLVKEAMDVQARMANRGIRTVEEFFGQGNLFGSVNLDPDAQALLKLFTERRPLEIRDALTDFARSAEADVPDQLTLSFYKPETAREAFDRIFKGPREEREFLKAAEEGAEYNAERGARSAERNKLEDPSSEFRVPRSEFDSFPVPSSAFNSPWRTIERDYPNDPRAQEQQLELWGRNLQREILDEQFRFETDVRPGLRTETGALARAKSGVETLGLAIRPELVNTGKVSFVGKEARTAEDIAVLGQIHRDPRFETLRIFYTKGGTIIGEEAVSSRMPSFSGAFVDNKSMPRGAEEMRRRMGRMGADGYFLLHNHPSGRVKPSANDLELTAQFSERVPGFKGHVIIDSGEYQEITGKGRNLTGGVRRLRTPDATDPLLQPSIEHEALGWVADSPKKVASLGRMVQMPQNTVALFYRDAGGKVRAIQSMPVNLFVRPKEATDFIRGQARAFGGTDVVAYVAQDNLPNQAVPLAGLEIAKMGGVLDVVYGAPRPGQGTSLSERGDFPRTKAMTLGRKDYPTWRVAEDPMAEARPLVEADEAAAIMRSGIGPAPTRILNINLARMDTPDAIKNVIVEAGILRAEEMKASRKRRVESDAELMAEACGMTVDEVMKFRHGQAANEVEALGTAMVLEQSARDISALGEKIREGQATDLDKIKFHKDTLRHFAIMQTAVGQAAEAGRALRSYSLLFQNAGMKLADMKDMLQNVTGKETVEALAEMVGTLDSTAKVSRFIRKAHEARTSDMLLEAWINAMLSGPQTHMVNALSNGLTSLWQIPERMLASEIGRVFGEREIAEGEALAQAYGMAAGMKDGLRMAWQTLKTGESQDPMGKVDVRQKAITGENLGLAGPAGRAADILGEIIRVPSRLLETSDAGFKAVGYRMELQARAFRQANGEGLTGQAAARRIQEIVDNPPEDIKLAAIDASRYVTFTDKLTGPAASVAAMVNKHPALRILLPFVRTPANVMRFAIMDRTPLGFMGARIRADMKAGGARRDLALARISLGSLVLGTVAALTAEGLVTGGGPVDKDMKKHLQAEGWIPYAFRLGGKYVSYGRLDPLSTIFGLGADVAEILAGLEENEAGELAAAAVMAVSRNITNKTYLRGISEAMEALSDPERYGERWLMSLAGTLVPTGVAQVARVMDPVVKDARSVLDRIRSRVPYWADGMPVRRDHWGEPIRVPQVGPKSAPPLDGGAGGVFYGFVNILNPMAISKARPSPVDKEILRLGVHIGSPPRQIDGVPLQAAEYDRYLELAGHGAKDPNTGLGLKDTLEKLIKTDQYKRRSDGEDGAKAYMLKDVVVAFRKLARQQLLAENRELRDLVFEHQKLRAQQMAQQQ